MCFSYLMTIAGRLFHLKNHIICTIPRSVICLLTAAYYIRCLFLVQVAIYAFQYVNVTTFLRWVAVVGVRNHFVVCCSLHATLDMSIFWLQLWLRPCTEHCSYKTPLEFCYITISSNYIYSINVCLRRFIAKE